MSSPRSPSPLRSPPFCRHEPEEAGTAVGLDVLRPVLPDIADVSPGPELLGLGRTQARSEAVQGVAVAVELVAPGADRIEHGIVPVSEPLRVAADVSIAGVEAPLAGVPGLATAGVAGVRPEGGFLHRCRGPQLDDVDALAGIGSGRIDGLEARAFPGATAGGSRCTRAHGQGQQEAEQRDVAHAATQSFLVTRPGVSRFC